MYRRIVAARVIAVRQRYGLTIDRREADALDQVLAGCESTALVTFARGAVPVAAAAATGSPEAVATWDDNGNGRVSCAEARAHGIAPVMRGHPAYPFMRDGDGDGVVCESGGRASPVAPSAGPAGAQSGCGPYRNCTALRRDHPNGVSRCHCASAAGRAQAGMGEMPAGRAAGGLSGPADRQALGDMAAELERERLFRLLEELVLWENTTNEEVLKRARDEIWQSWRRACAEHADHPHASELFDRHTLPAFHDPFAGGGALPLEAQRLGLEAHASDLNPVAVLINKAMIEIPPKFAGRPPVNPESRNEPTVVARTWRGAQGLAEDVRHYGRWMRDEAEKRRRFGTAGPVAGRYRRDGGRGLFGVELPAGDVGLDEHARRVHVREGDHLPAEQTAIPIGVLVVAVRVGEALVLPGQQPDAGVDGAQQHGRFPQARQVEVAREVVDELPDLHVVATPQRHPVELHPEARAREAGRQQLVALQPARGPVRQGALPGQPRRLPGDRASRRCLDRRQEPLVRLRQPGRDGFGGCVPLRLRLPDLMRRQIEHFPLGEDRFPGQVVTDRLVEVLQPRQVRGQEDERVAVEPRRGPA